MRLLSSFLFAMSLVSCTPSYKMGFETQGTDQFVIDSYKIQGGKNAILSLQGKEVAPLPEDSYTEFKDTIQESDVIHVTAFHPSRDDLVKAIHTISGNSGFKIVDGKMSFPDLPPVYVQGLTLNEAEVKVKELYLDHSQDIDIFMTYKTRLFRSVNLISDIISTTVPIDGKTRLYDVLSKGRIIGKVNWFTSYVLRDGKHLSVDLYKLLKEGDMSQNLIMKDQDVVYLASKEDAKIMLMGEVGRPQVLPVESGSISLREALVTAGGLPFTANPNYIQVIRGDLKSPKIYTLSWNEITHLPNSSLLLIPGDTVLVGEKPITSWNRFISQIFPSLEGLQKANGTYRIVSK